MAKEQELLQLRGIIIVETAGVQINRSPSDFFDRFWSTDPRLSRWACGIGHLQLVTEMGTIFTRDIAFLSSAHRIFYTAVLLLFTLPYLFLYLSFQPLKS
jgi:hypothetical protein